MISPPVLQAMVLADHIYTDVSGKRIICGTFSVLNVAQFPKLFARETWLFLYLVDVAKSFSLQLRFVHLHDNKVLMQSQPVGLQSKGPLTPLDIVIQVPPFPLVAEGFYSLECWAEDHLLGALRLQARIRKQEEIQ